MKEIPILFSTPMVQAILDDRKTMTRRIVKFRNKKWRLSEANEPNRTDLDAFGVLDENGNLIEIEEGAPGTIKELGLCPYGRPGDILWVRETWQWMEGFAGSGYYVFKSDFKLKNGEWQKEISNKFHDVEVVRIWKPSIFMPKEAARIWLQVTDVRVERLRDISAEDILAEGIGEKHHSGATSMTTAGIDYRHWEANQKIKFQKLWEKINGAESWEANPWVWVISYKILSTAGKPDLQSLKTIA